MQIDTMLERLHIRRYRGLRDLTVDGLGRINLIAGRNNVGKTTLLEAVYLLAAGGNARVAMDDQITRMASRSPAPRAVAETFWKPFFFNLDVNDSFTVSGTHASLGRMTLTVTLDQSTTTTVEKLAENGALESPFYGRLLRFSYVDERTGPEPVQSSARETPDRVLLEMQKEREPKVAFSAGLLLPGFRHPHEHAVSLAEVRRRKRGAGIRNALRVIEPRLQSIEDNSSSGEPLIWVDIGLRELIPLSIMGAGMERLADLLIVAESVTGGVLLVDEIENGLYHAFLPDVWRVIEKAAKENNLQVIATTHSHEYVQAAHAALAPEGFRLHRLEAADDGIRCVTYTQDEIESAIEFDFEVR